MAGPSSSGRPSPPAAGDGPGPGLAYEVLEGSLVRFTSAESRARSPPPTVVLVHGILGSRKNLRRFAERILGQYPAWQAVLVDLRNHGESSAGFEAPGESTVDSSAADVLALLGGLRLFPSVLVGHSFGGKVVLSMARQFAARFGAGARLPRRVDAWVLDTVPGEVRAGGAAREDHPEDLIAALKELPMPLAERSQLVSYLASRGFSPDVGLWMCTNLRPTRGADGAAALEWAFDLGGVEEMYRSYESTCLWDFVGAPPEGLDLNFVRAEHSTFRWSGDDRERLEGSRAEVHLLEDSGHWVHADNPEGLFRIMLKSFDGPHGLDASMRQRQRRPAAPPGSP